MATATESKPKKPYPEFPLFAHGNGQWCKKIKGKQWFFGVWSDPDAALRKYLDEVDEIQAGRDPRKTGVVEVSPSELTVYDMLNMFLERQQTKVQEGAVTARHFSDCFRTCKRFADHFGKFFRASAFKAADFKAYKDGLPKTWGTSMVSGEIQRVRTAFRWAFEADLLPSLPNFGPDFKKPSKMVVRREQQQRQAQRGGKLDFSSEELRLLVQSSSKWLKACILLGINGGLGNADCGRLTTKMIDLESGWYDLPREKTGIDRRFPLWPETIQALKDAIRDRPIAKNPDDRNLCFLTSHGMPVWWQRIQENGETYLCDNVSKAFSKLTAKCKVDRLGRSFYSLRRTFETVAGASKDQVAVDLMMGHADNSMAAIYRQGIEDKRLQDVSDHVRKWLFGDIKAKAKKPKQRAKKKASK